MAAVTYDDANTPYDWGLLMYDDGPAAGTIVGTVTVGAST